MPASVINSFSDKYNIPKDRLEKYWEEAKEAAKDEKDKGDEAFYGTVMTIFKNKVKAHENVNIKENLQTLAYSLLTKK